MPRYVNIDEYLKDTFCDKFDDCILEEECLVCWARQHTEDVAPVVHAKWISIDDKEMGYRCSECGEMYWGSLRNFCPNCGAKMDKENV